PTKKNHLILSNHPSKAINRQLVTPHLSCSDKLSRTSTTEDQERPCNNSRSNRAIHHRMVRAATLISHYNQLRKWTVRNQQPRLGRSYHRPAFPRSWTDSWQRYFDPQVQVDSRQGSGGFVWKGSAHHITAKRLQSFPGR